MGDPLVILFDGFFTLLGLGLCVYAWGYSVVIWKERPMVVRHPRTRQWTAARSLKELPPTAVFTRVPRSHIEESHGAATR